MLVRVNASLRNRNYRLYFYGQMVSQIGNSLQNAAQAWFVLQLTNSPAALGVLGFCLYAPYAVLGLFGGAFADRWDRRATMIVTQTGMALAAAALAAVAYLHVDAVWAVDLIALFFGIILPFENPSRQALMLQLVGREELANAIGLNASLGNATRVIGPALAGVMIATVGVGACFALNAVSFFAVIAALLVMRRSEFHEAMTVNRQPLFASIGAGFAYARTTKAVWMALLMMATLSTLSMNFAIMLPVLAKSTLAGSAQTYGWLASALALGGVGGATFAASRKHLSRTHVLIAAAGFGATELLVASQHTVTSVIAALIATGFCYTLYTATTNTLVQLATPSELQGRIAGLAGYVFVAVGPLGALITGALTQHGGAPFSFIVGGLAGLTMALAGYLIGPWPLETPPNATADSDRQV